MIIVADSGSTKTDWILIDNKKFIDQKKTDGINPFYQNTESIIKTISSLSIWEGISKIYFYGAGCANPEKNKVVEDALQVLFPNAICEINSDLLAAARSLCGKKQGIACILGTGSNSCLYNGNEIEQNVSPLGFILGDEGSGAVLGKKLVADILKNQAPTEIQEAFFNKYRVSAAEIIHKVYRKEFPNRYLASFTRFLSENCNNTYVAKLVKESFVEFFRRNIKQYPDSSLLPIHFTGSIAFYFKTELELAAKEESLKVGTITQSPLEDLLHFHMH